jgi:hypothetical protein
MPSNQVSTKASWLPNGVRELIPKCLTWAVAGAETIKLGLLVVEKNALKILPSLRTDAQFLPVLTRPTSIN